MLDQHRLQPWAYQFLLLAFLLGAVRSIWSVPYCRWLTVSIYAWSAWSKLDRSFLSDGGLGQQFAATLFQAVSLPRPAPGVLVVGSWCIVLGELLVAALLAMPGTRRVGVAMALVLHAALLLILGPMGMNHSSGVLLWNVFFLVLVPLLFWPWEATAEEGDCWKSPRAACGAAVVAMAIGWPSLEPLGGCDNWLAWALYSSRAERAIVLIERSAADQLPPDMQHYLRETPEGGVERLRIDLWSLESLGVPIYPENRFRLGVARALAESFELGRGLEVTLEGPAGRITGQRSSQRLRGTDEIAAAGEASWFNTRPRNNKPEAQSEGPAQGSQPQQ